MAGAVTVTGLAAGLPGGEKILGPITVTGTATIGEILDLTLSSGDTTITIPTGAIGVVFIPPVNNTATIKYRTSANSSDGGLPIAPTQPFVHVFNGTPSSLILNASVGLSATCELWFW